MAADVIHWIKGSLMARVARIAGEGWHPPVVMHRAEQLTFAAASALFFGLTAFYANRKLLWFDELFTVFIARQPDLASFFAATTSGGDTLPPGIHLATRLSMTIFGQHHLSIRLPVIGGYWLMLVGVYGFVRHRCSRLAAWSAALVPLATNTYWYAFDARPYGLLLGFSAMALVAWQRAPGIHRARWLVGLAGALLAALLTHWYAVLLLPPLILGECLRMIESGERRAGVFLAMGIAIATAAPILYPFAIHGLRFRGIIDTPDVVTFVFTASDLLLGGFAPFLVLLLAVAALRPAKPHDQRPLAWSDLATAVAFGLLPVGAFILAWMTRSQLLPRYAVCTVIGDAILVGYAADHVAGSDRRRAVAWVGVLVIAVSTNLVIEKLRLPDRSRIGAGIGDFGLLPAMDRLSPSEVVVVPDGMTYIRLAYYAPSAIARRLIHVEDTGSIGSRALTELAAFAPLQVERVDDFTRRTPSFGLYDVGLESPALAALARHRVGLSSAGPLDSAQAYGALYQVHVEGSQRRP
jgi:hypothetical protein